MRNRGSQSLVGLCSGATGTRNLAGTLFCVSGCSSDDPNHFAQWSLVAFAFAATRVAAIALVQAVLTRACRSVDN